MESPGFESEHEQGPVTNQEQQQPGGEEKPKRRRNRKPVTCAQCRKRKLKCDRGSPCGACKDRNEGHLCEWEGAIRLPQSNYTRDQEAVELRSQLDRLEGLLGMLSGDMEGGVRMPDDPERTSAAEALGLLAGTSSASGSGSRTSSSQPPILPFGSPQTLDQILSILPTRVELDILVQQFLREEVPLFPIVHTPTFRERVRTFDIATARSEPIFAALLLAISGWATYWRTTDPRARGAAAVKEGTIKMYVNSAMEILHISGFTEIPSMDAFRTLLVLHHYYIQQDSSSAKHLLNTAIQMAQDLGLNRDPSSFNCFTVLEAEERRRIWTVLLSLDWLDNSGRTYLCSSVHCDTLLPANARDEEVGDTGVLNRPLTYATPMLHTLFIFQIAAAAHSITDRAYGLQLVPTYATIIELSSELSRIDSSLPPCLAFEWTNGAIRPFPGDLSSLDQTRVYVHLQLRQQFIRLHRPFLTRGFVDTRFAFSRDKVCWAARYILAIHRGLGDDHRATRSWRLLFHAMNALCILAFDLLQDPRGSYADIHHQDVASSLKLLEARLNKSSTVKEVLRVVGVLLRRSDGTELLKKRKHDEISQQRAVGYNSGGAGEARSSELSSFLSNQTLPSAFRNPSDLPPIPAPQLEPILRPFDANVPFTRPLPIPMSVDPITIFHAKGVSKDPEFSGLWKGLSRVSGMYAVPDFEEWEELVEGRGWRSGIDLLC